MSYHSTPGERAACGRVDTPLDTPCDTTLPTSGSARSRSRLLSRFLFCLVAALLVSEGEVEANQAKELYDSILGKEEEGKAEKSQGSFHDQGDNVRK
jgi:hypothetical protein